MLLESVLIVGFVCVLTKGESFPSLITTNATLAIVVDREYLAEEYDSIRASIESYLVYAKREILKNGGVNVQFFSWSSIDVRRDITAVLSIASCFDTWRLFQTATKENLFHMAISESDCPRLPINEAVTVPLLTKGEELPQLLLDLRTVKAYKWNSAVILYDETLKRDQVTRVIKSITVDSSNLFVGAAAISLMKLNTRGNSVEFKQSLNTTLYSLKRNKNAVGLNFLVIVSFNAVELIMEYAKNLQLVNTKTQWMYVISDTTYKTRHFDKFRQLLQEGDNVAFLYNSTIISGSCSGGLKCHSEEILSAFSRALDEAVKDEFELASQVSDEEWEAIRPSKTERRNFLLKSVKNYLLKFGTCDNCTAWVLKTGDTWGREYQQNLSSSENVADLIPVGKWRPSDGPSLEDELFPHIAHGFRRRNLPLVSYHNPPWQIITQNASGAVLNYGGLVFDVINELSRNLNFTYTVDVLKINELTTINSSKNSTNEWRTDIVPNRIPEIILDLVKNKTVAFGACAFTITEKNRHEVNFTIPLSTQTYTFLVARPRELSRALLFMSPFTGDTWLCLAAAIVSMGPVLFYIHRYSPVYEYKGIRSKGGLSSIENCIWYMYGALLQQGGMHLPYADSARLIVGAWWLVVLVVATTYCGNLVAFLTFPKIDIPITTIDELIAHQDTVTWSLVNGSFLEEELKITPQTVFRHIYEKRVDRRKGRQFIKEIEDGKHVYIDWKIRLQYIMKSQYLESDRCDLALGLDEFFDEQLAMIVAQDTPYLGIINEEIKKLHQVGLVEKWLKDYLPKKDRCWKNRNLIEVNNHTVNMDDMQGSFFVLFLGFVLSVLIILIEKLCHKYTVRKKEKVIQPFTS